MINNIPVLRENKAFWQKSWFWIAILALAAVVLLIVYKGKGLQEANKVEEIKKALPAYFIPADVVVSASGNVDTSKYQVSDKESLQEGVRYTVSKPKLDVVKEFLITMDEKGWSAGSGSRQDDKETIIKFSNETEILIAHIEAVSPQETQVIILPVKR